MFVSELDESKFVRANNELFEAQQLAKAHAAEALKRFASGQITLLISLTVIVLTLLRVFVVSHGSAETAFGIIGSVSSTSILIPALFSILAILPGPLLIVASTLTAEVEGLRPSWLESWYERATLLLLAAAPAIIFWPLFALPILMLYCASSFVSIPRQRRANTQTIRDAVAGSEVQKRRLKSLRPRPRVLEILVLSTVFLTIFVTLDRPWGASEVFEVDGETFVGFEMSQGDGELVILKEKERLLIRVPDAELKSRTYCADELHESLYSLAVEAPNYPPCKGRE